MIGNAVAVAGVRAQSAASDRARRLSPADALLRSRCLGSRTLARAAPSGLRLHETGRTTWGFLLGGSSAGFQPGEPVLTLVFEPRWRIPACLENANASLAGIAQSDAAVWYRAAVTGPYRLCLVGVGSGRVACGRLTVSVRSAGSHSL